MGFGERLTLARKALHMTQADLGKGLGTGGTDVGKQVVYGWEKDQHYPRVDQLMLICEKLNVSADWLLFGAVVPSSNPRFAAAQAAVAQLSEPDRIAFLAAIQSEPAPDHVVEAKMAATRIKPATNAEQIIKAQRVKPNPAKKITKKHA